jgi:putative ABC transport system ATP-binding protein
MSSILKVENVTKEFNNNEEILHGISLNIEKGTFTVILGPSGSGKTTLLNIMSGLLKPTSGKVFYKETDIANISENRLADWRRTEAGSIFQNYLLLNNLTARENILIGISPSSTPLPFEQLIRLLEIDTILEKFPAQLSGGQQQRVAIARAVIKKPNLLFCDEATGSLDEANSKKVVELLLALKSEFGITILFTTHNHQIAETADRVITIKDGLLYHDKSNDNPIAASEMVWG